MSQRNRVLAAMGLTVALTFAMPAPSHAVGLWQAQASTLAVRAWSWLEGRLGLIPRRSPVPARQPANVREKQGSAIDPNGRSVRFFVVVSDPTLLSEQGSAIDPNGGE